MAAMTCKAFFLAALSIGIGTRAQEDAPTSEPTYYPTVTQLPSLSLPPSTSDVPSLEPSFSSDPTKTHSPSFEPSLSIQPSVSRCDPPTNACTDATGTIGKRSCIGNFSCKDSTSEYWKASNTSCILPLYLLTFTLSLLYYWTGDIGDFSCRYEDFFLPFGQEGACEKSSNNIGNQSWWVYLVISLSYQYLCSSSFLSYLNFLIFPQHWQRSML